MVVINDDVNESSEYLNNKQDFPTPFIQIIKFKYQTSKFTYNR
jgi:hypothetical protein